MSATTVLNPIVTAATAARPIQFKWGLEVGSGMEAMLMAASGLNIGRGGIVGGRRLNVERARKQGRRRPESKDESKLVKKPIPMKMILQVA